MEKAYQQVREFHNACDEKMPDEPLMLSISKGVHEETANSLSTFVKIMKVYPAERSHAYQRASWMLEELTEFIAADTIEDQADALIDLIYFAIGTFTLMGINPEPIFDIVQEANMAKVGPDGKVQRNEQGKIIKPDGWKEKYSPEQRIAAEIERQRQSVKK